jgi:hypothetical protein
MTLDSNTNRATTDTLRGKGKNEVSNHEPVPTN